MAFIPCRFGHCSTASNKHGRISPHVAIPGYELVPIVAVHALRKLIAAGSGHLVQSRDNTGWHVSPARRFSRMQQVVTLDFSLIRT